MMVDYKPNKEAFTLLEVLIAMAIFFVSIFAILELTSENLRSARALQADRPSPKRLAVELASTNQVQIGVTSGDFGDQYPGYAWERKVSEWRSNGLLKADFRVFSTGRSDNWESEMSIYLFRPNAGGSLGSRLGAQ